MATVKLDQSAGVEVSVIVCSRNRASGLINVLRNLKDLTSKCHRSVEIVVVDNASTDSTAAMVAAEMKGAIPLVYVFEGNLGLDYARNAGLRFARGKAILFIDDDVFPQVGWVESMAGPLLSGRADAVAGGFFTPPEFVPIAMQESTLNGPFDSSYFLATDIELMGLNMGLNRRVLSKIGGFDVALDAGRLGFGGDTLFSLRLRNAGFHILCLERVRVAHCPDPSRFERKALLKRARQTGQSDAYMNYHWHQKEERHVKLRWWYHRARVLAHRTLTSGLDRYFKNGQSLELLASGERNWGYCLQWRLEATKPRLYAGERQHIRN